MSVYDHCPQCPARLQRAAHKDIYRPASRQRRAMPSVETRLAFGRFFFKHLARCLIETISHKSAELHEKSNEIFQNNFRFL